MKLPQPDPCAGFPIWAADDASASEDDRPLYAFQYDDLLDQCRMALSARQKSYPELVAARKITAADAAADLRAWEDLVAEWLWICTGEGKLPPAGTLAARRAAVDLAIERIDQRFERGGRSHDLYRQAHLAMALRWHLHRLRFGAPAVHFYAETSRQLRAEAQANASRKEAA